MFLYGMQMADFAHVAAVASSRLNCHSLGKVEKPAIDCWYESNPTQ